MLTSNSSNNIRKHEEGFTLIELSIVLVIIGLIVGGILTGQDLIKSAEQRATIAQIEKYNTAVNTFRGKYGGIPGDLLEGSAVNFGLFAMSTAGTVGGAGFGDGNGVLAGGSATAAFNGEVTAFWRHLSDAGLIDGAFGATGAGAGQLVTDGTIAAATTGAANIGLLFPAAKIGRGNFVTAQGNGGINYFIISGLGGTTASFSTAGVVSNGTNNLTALEAYNIDKKMDDGAANSGSVFAIDGTAALSTAATLSTLSTVAACNNNTSAYVVNPGTTPACSLRFKFN